MALQVEDYINKRPTVSVIISLYNLEDYVEKCLNSVICQTLNDIEIIVICDIVKCAFYSCDNDANVIERCKLGIYDRRQALMSTIGAIGGSFWNKINSSTVLFGAEFR